MKLEKHYQNLIQMYQSSPINRYYSPTLEIGKGTAEIVIPVKEDFFHAAGAVHGSVYFKILDDAAFFAANSLDLESFVLTSSFTTYLIRPISEGKIRATGKVVSETKSQFIAESIAYNDQGKEIGRGNGIFVRGKSPLSEEVGYKRK